MYVSTIVPVTSLAGPPVPVEVEVDVEVLVDDPPVPVDDPPVPVVLLPVLVDVPGPPPVPVDPVPPSPQPASVIARKRLLENKGRYRMVQGLLQELPPRNSDLRAPRREPGLIDTHARRISALSRRP
jgi:hypothetical protein